MTEHRPYFAYGSNMNPERMLERCPGAEKVGKATLKGWRFLINCRGYATIEPCATSQCYGGVWMITPSHERILDLREGVHIDCYARKFLDVVLDSGEVVNALVYVDPRTSHGSPSEDYMHHINAGAAAFELPDSYVHQLNGWAETPPQQEGGEEA